MLIEKQHQPQAIGQIGLAGEIYSWLGHRRCAHATYKAKARNSSRQDQVLHQIEAVLIHVRADNMGRQIPRLRGQLDADVATDLANPHLKPVNRERCQPQP